LSTHFTSWSSQWSLSFWISHHYPICIRNLSQALKLKCSAFHSAMSFAEIYDGPTLSLFIPDFSIKVKLFLCLIN
jgi:hypothetical protein